MQDAIPTLQDAQCGYCGRTVTLERVGPIVGTGETERFQDHTAGVVYATHVCPRAKCSRPSIAQFVVSDGMYGISIKEGPHLLPRGVPQPMTGLPDEIQQDRREAWSCYYGGDLRASVIMGRAAIQRAVRNLNANVDGLKAEINDLRQRGVITTFLKEWADEVRIAGDDAAHPEGMAAISQAEAEESLTFMDAFLDHAIALPAARDQRKNARKGTTSRGAARR